MSWWITHKWADLLPWDRRLQLEVTCTPHQHPGSQSHGQAITHMLFTNSQTLGFLHTRKLLIEEGRRCYRLPDTAPCHIRVTVYILVTGKTRTPGFFTTPCSRLAAGLHSPEGANCDDLDLHVKQGQESWCRENLMAHLVLTSDTMLSTLGFTRITVSKVSLRWWRVLWPGERKGIRQDERSWWDSIQLLMF